MYMPYKYTNSYKNSEDAKSSAFLLQCFTQNGFRCIRIEAHIRHIACKEFIIGLGADHGTVVATKLQRGHKDLSAQFFRSFQNILPDPGIGSHTAGNRYRPVAGLLQRPNHSRHQGFRYRCGKGSTETGNVQLLPYLIRMVDQIQCSRLQTGEAHVVGILTGFRHRERILGFVTLLGSLIKGSAAGIGNAALAVRALNGARAEAGETLSFNAAVGRRTEANGYAVAEEPAYGADISGVGGGVCQASTILYRAALLGGVEIAERNAAAYPVIYCGMGQEAAVSDQGLDLVIRNQTDTPLFVMARTYEDGGKTFAELTLIGEELGVRYALESISKETETITEPVYVRDREGKYATYSDERVPVGEALAGYAAIVERVTLDKDGQETAREMISENEYEAVPPMIYVGVTER